MDDPQAPPLGTGFSVEDCEGPIPRRFEALAREWPGRVAVRDASGSTTYGDLDARANLIAQAVLRERGHGEEAVALVLGKDTMLIAAFLAVLKAGKIYVPLDPAHPLERSRLVMEHSGATLVLTDARYAEAARAAAGLGRRVLDLATLEGAPAGPPALPLTGDTLATILYTSGPTGRPKGVLQNHRNTLHNCWNATRSLGVTPADRILLVQSGSVMGGVRDTLTALLNGATLALYDLPGLGVGPLAEHIRREGITIMNTVVTVFRHFVAGLGDADRFPTVRVVKTGSEATAPSDVEAFRRHFPELCVLWSGFGGTETGNVTQLLIDRRTPLPAGAVPAGRPLPGMEVLVLDEARRPLPPGEPGEVVVRSRYLALGYWGRPDLTEQAFRPDPEGGERRLYFTGDLGRRAPDGGLVLLGRRDSMVKVRGQRAELGEIEQALQAVPGVKQAAVVARERAPGDARLVAYVSWQTPPGAGADELRRALRRTLPAHMVPDRFVALPALPATPQGKIDRRALPAPDWTRIERAGSFVEPRTPIERELALIWADALGLESVGLTDAFLDLGGHSLVAGRIAARVLERFRVSLVPASLLAAATIEDMANLVLNALLAQASPAEREQLRAALGDV